MKRAVVCILTACLLAGGCYKKEAERLEEENMRLINRAVKLEEEMAIRDSVINSVALHIHRINRRFGIIDASQRLVVEESSDLELEQRKNVWRRYGEKMLGRLRAMDDELAANRKSLRSLRYLVNKYKGELEQLQTVVASLESTNVAKQRAIDELELRVEEQVADIRRLETTVAEKEETIREKEDIIEEKEKELNTAYYLSGGKKELLEQGIVQKEGGIFGFGATTVLAPGSGKAPFTAIEKTRETIDLQGEIKELIPRRSMRAYGLEIREDGTSTIHIVDREMFWRSTPLLVVLVKK